MHSAKIEILLIEDNLPEADLIKEMLSEARQQEFSVQHVQSLAGGLSLLRSRDFDVVLVDLGLPDSQGLETALTVRRQSKRTPVVALTVLDDEETALKSLQMDIQDYLIKGEINGNLLSRAIRYAIQRKRDDDSLRFSEARYRVLFRDNPTMIFTLDTDWTILSANPFSATQLGYTIDELEGQSVLKVFNEGDRPAVIEQLQRCLQNPDQVYRWQFRKFRKDGGLLWVEETAQAVYDLKGTLNILVVCQDITERKRAEAEIHRLASFPLMNPNPALELDADGKVTFCNPAAKHILEKAGYDDSVIPFIPQDMPMILQDLRDNKAGQFHREVEINGSFFEELVYIVPQFQSVRIYTMDSTERKRAEKALRKSELKFSKIFHSVPALLAISTMAEGRCIDVNETSLRTLGYQREEMVGRTAAQLGIWGSKAERDRIIRILEEKGMVRDLEITFSCKSGQTFTGLLSAESIEFNGERYMLSMVNDITERKRMEEVIERLNTDLAARAAELEDTNRELEAFNYTVAHDLRKPLTIINGYCQAIKELCDDLLDEACREYLRETYDGTLRMNRLIDALLKFSSMSHVELRRETVDLSGVAHEVATELAQAEPARQIEFRITEGISVMGDAALLRVVLDNLLGNAWKYTFQQEEAVIEFGETTIGEETAYFISDNGPGFDMADAEKLFVPFQRIAGKAESVGHGIGLATVERIIRRHGGRAWAEGELGKGATFYFTLQN